MELLPDQHPPLSFSSTSRPEDDDDGDGGDTLIVNV